MKVQGANTHTHTYTRGPKIHPFSFGCRLKIVCVLGGTCVRVPAYKTRGTAVVNRGICQPEGLALFPHQSLSSPRLRHTHPFDYNLLCVGGRRHLIIAEDIYCLEVSERPICPSWNVASALLKLSTLITVCCWRVDINSCALSLEDATQLCTRMQGKALWYLQALHGDTILLILLVPIHSHWSTGPHCWY